MEQDCIVALHQSLGMSAGVVFSSEDVSLLFSKVFHVNSNTSEAHAAMNKISRGDNSWSCTTGNILDVLLEMERERDRKDMLYWEFQLLNARTLHHMMDGLHQCTDPNMLKNAYNSETGFLESCMTETDSSQIGGLVVGKILFDGVTHVKRLKKAARQRWAGLASEGVQSLLPPPWQGQSIGLRGRAWGCVSFSDILLLVEVKYDVVKQLLYTEMLQEHHTRGVWETLLPWQQQEEVELLEDLTEEALESLDMLHLALLPGAFRIYKAYLDESGQQSWSAVSLLKELHKYCQQEQDALTALGQRLLGESPTLLCLYNIRLATLKAQREKISYRALLAVQQSWETWPQVVSPCRAEQIALWLHGDEEEEEKKEDFKTLQQETVLQLLVLTQEQERKYLVKLLHAISWEDLQGAGYTFLPKEDSETSAFRAGCIKRLRQIHAQLQTQSGTLSKQTNPQTQIQGEWFQPQLDNCTITLLTHLMELQNVQAVALVQALADRDIQCVKALQDKYEDEIQTQRFTNLLHLLISDAPLNSSFAGIPSPNLNENGNKEQIIQRCSHTSEDKNPGGRSAETLAADSSGVTGKVNEVQTADGSDKQEVCTGCGAVMEDLPYLEVLCFPETQASVNDIIIAEDRGTKGEESGATKNPQSCKKQGSLITLAWSKPNGDGTVYYEADAADGETEQDQDDRSSLKIPIQCAQCEGTVQERDVEELTSARSPDGSHADQQFSMAQQKTVEDKPDEKGPGSERDRQTIATVAANLHPVQPHLSRDSSKHADDCCSETSSCTMDLQREMTEVEMCPTEIEPKLWDLREPELSTCEGLTPTQDLAVDCSISENKVMQEPTLTESKQEGEAVSALERERTMRSLVDMQRKVEKKQQQDRERQLLRVQERLAIVQNRKTEEDLLGLKHTGRPQHLTQDLPLENKSQQKTAVRERLEQIRRERSYIMQFKRNRNTAGFKKLLAPVALHSNDTEGGAD